MGDLTSTLHKSLLPLNGLPLIEHQIKNSHRALPTLNTFITTGYLHSSFPDHLSTLASFIFNPSWDSMNMVGTLSFALRQISLSDHLLITYGDSYYSHDFFRQVFDHCSTSFLVPSYSDWLDQWSQRYSNPLDDLESFIVDTSNKLVSIGNKPDSLTQIQGQFCGCLYVPQHLLDSFTSFLLSTLTSHPNACLTSTLNHMIASGFSFSTVPVPELSVLEVDTASDYSYLTNTLQS